MPLSVEQLMFLSQNQPNRTEVPPRLGPTGKLFSNISGDKSSELLITIEDDRLNKGLPTNVPLLVPKQINVERLLLGAEPTEEQVGKSIDYALGLRKPPQGFATIKEAVNAARTRSNIKGFLYKY